MKLLAALVSLLLIAGIAPRAQAGASRFDALIGFAEARMREHKIPGVAIGIVDNGTITTRGLGITNVEEPLPVTDHTVFPIASISKTFAATAMMRLVEQGRVDLKAPVRRYLPDFKVRDAHVSRDATVWNLLTHSGGWEGQIAGPERGEDTLRNFVATVMADNMQIAPPAAAWSYNNAGYSVAGHLIEAVTKTSINRAMRDLVFTPLGLNHAGTTTGDFIVNRFAAGHVQRNDAPALMRPYTHATSVTSGGIGVCIDDLMTYAKFHLGDGTNAKGERILSQSSLDLMQTVQLEKQSTDDAIGIGWHIRRIGNARVLGQGGTAGGHILVLSIVPERNFAIGILTNAQNGWRLIQEVEREALRSYHGLAYGRNQAIAHRGLVETLPNIEPLSTQPDYRQYAGRYQRPMNIVEVRIDNGTLLVQEMPNNGEARPAMPITFFGPDRAVVTDGNDKGQSIEFVRDAAGAVKWIRVVGRVAVRN
ncbi:MAG TPA: serine hydrolase domain-containing protein [Vicinamibacterales bacterium]|nr:serine hydrolase domain-containing protein [Vicinamibacterales bacterium]